MNSTKKTLTTFGSYLTISLGLLLTLITYTNGQYRPSQERYAKRDLLLRNIHVASPAIITVGRNISFESGNAISNSPGSYINMLDCCEADEAIADRIQSSNVTATLIRKKR